MLNFYNVDQDYIQYLKVVDRKIPDIGYNSHDKFICGIVLNINGLKYYAPISSNKNIYRTSFAIKNKGNILSTIRFSFMFPAVDNAIEIMDFKKIARKDKKYADLLLTEWRYCISRETEILRQAFKVYNIGCNKNHMLSSLCCDFIALEEAAKQYNK